MAQLRFHHPQLRFRDLLRFAVRYQRVSFRPIIADTGEWKGNEAGRGIVFATSDKEKATAARIV